MKTCQQVLRVGFDSAIKLEFHGAKVSSDAGLFPFRDLDEAAQLTESSAAGLFEFRTASSIRHAMTALPRQSSYSRLTGMAVYLYIRTPALLPGGGHMGNVSSGRLLTQWACILGSSLLLVGCTDKESGSKPDEQKEGATVPLAISPQTGLMTFRAWLNGREITMAVDTGANTTTFDTHLIDKLQLQAKEAGLNMRVDGPLAVKVAHVKEFQVGSFTYSFDATFVDLGNPNKGLTTLGDVSIDGLLGMDFLSKWKAVIDCQKKTMVMY